jgi:ribosomal protein S12 methylthiotransferase accessory factor
VQQVEAYLAERGRDLAILDLTADMGIPVFAAISRRRDRQPSRSCSARRHLDPGIALLRAVAELNQMLMRVLWQVEDPAAMAGEPSVREWLDTATIADHPHLVADALTSPRRANEFATSGRTICATTSATASASWKRAAWTCWCSTRRVPTSACRSSR